ncbi:glutamate--tRNA ligase [Telmatospirillum sp. J64-1]|uniref:glutamate--tRNA ligase n=1 Tax=Telmatospirillum sp. J64-1 TaxID=2502183 RepID=UPI00115F55AA|nr:glutamate--tRNA ligase [Telmatospirillum sp. J64-1]
MNVLVRFAPSPTGLLHVGNARVALVNWLFAKSHGGYFLLRMDDTDTERSRPEFADGIMEDLRWLGLTWDRKAWQSQRHNRYAAAVEQLKALGRLYPCWETPEELEAKRKRRLAQGKPPVYDRAALKLSEADKARLQEERGQPHWRFKLESREVAWEDMARGHCHFHPDHLSDPVLLRGDGLPLYTLCSVVDDAELGVTHIIRGEDHVTNTAVQVQLFQALGASVPEFGHLPLLTDISGGGLSKRLGSGSLRELREQGIQPMALNSLLAKLGTSDAIQLRHSLDELIDEFDIGKFGRSTPKFDPAELAHLNSRLVHEMPYEEARSRLEAMGMTGVDEALWTAVRGNLERLDDMREWWGICRGEVAPVIEDADFTAQAAGLLPPEPWDEDTWGRFTAAVKEATGRKGKGLFHPLRLAITGREQGPELKTLLPLIGRARVEARLKGRTA